MASVIAALAAAAGVYFTGRSLESTRAQNALTEQGQLTDRFTKAVDQLDRAGADHLQARLGAVYALERLALDSARDHPTIIEVLSAFIRTTSARPTPTSGTDDPCPKKPAPDVQAALSVLGRRDLTRDLGALVDLRGACLSGADLGDTRLGRPKLTDANLTNAKLTNADLTNADLTNADLTNAKLTNADLTNADLTNADLTNANFIRANLTTANLTDANLTSTNLAFVNLTNAHLVLADLTDADLNSANLAGANLGGANLTSTYLSRANLAHADLRHANLTHADLGSATLTDARYDKKTVVENTFINERTKGAWW